MTRAGNPLVSGTASSGCELTYRFLRFIVRRPHTGGERQARPIEDLAPVEFDTRYDFTNQGLQF